VRTPTSALFFALEFLLACVLVLAKHRLVYRILGGLVAVLFLAMVLSVPGPGIAIRLEHFILFWLCLVTLIPIRVLLSWSIQWNDEPPRQTRLGQFAIADFLSLTAAIGVTLTFFRLLLLGSGSLWTQLPEALGTIAGCSIVAAPCVWLAFSQVNRVRGGLWITCWVLGISIFWMTALLVWYSKFQVLGWTWGHVMLLGTRDIIYLIALELSLLCNIFALEWLGVRWSRAPICAKINPDAADCIGVVVGRV
jgi:hypothetical protein